VPAVEVLVMNGRIYDMVINHEQTHLIPTVLEDGEYYGMQTFDQHLTKLYRDRLITLDEALSAATNPHDLTVRLRQAGLA
jgi:twitching motility protein PilT